MHTLLMREHNRMVDYLKRINPHWNDEQLFQNGRRILSAVNQHITYNEFLPRVLGWNAINLYGLNLDSEGYFNGKSTAQTRRTPSCDAKLPLCHTNNGREMTIAVENPNYHPDIQDSYPISSLTKRSLFAQMDVSV